MTAANVGDEGARIFHLVPTQQLDVQRQQVASKIVYAAIDGNFGDSPILLGKLADRRVRRLEAKTGSAQAVQHLDPPLKLTDPAKYHRLDRV